MGLRMSEKIVVNARYTHRRAAGVERYAREISSRLFPSPRLVAPARAMTPLAGHLWEQFVLPAKLNADEFLWSPANASAWLVRRQAVTIHDASPFDHPEWFDPSFSAWTRLAWKVLSKTARAIITVSNFSRARLKFHLGIDDRKLFVIPDGVGKPFGPQSQKAIDETLARYRIKPPYFLFVGTLEPRKNLGRLFEAWKEAQTKLAAYSLVVAGGAGTVFRGKGFTATPEKTRLLGYVPDEDLPPLYAGAKALIAPSLYEGFCLPALETMACGTPVIASNVASLPEVTDGAAYLVNPMETRQISEAMQAMAENESLANRCRERGLAQAQNFNWEDSAGKLHALLKSLHD
jgi:glycosyltransferase involved in cell wall biosynthesis